MNDLPVSKMIDNARLVLRTLARYEPLNRDLVGDLAIHVLALAAALGHDEANPKPYRERGKGEPAP